MEGWWSPRPLRGQFPAGGEKLNLGSQPGVRTASSSSWALRGRGTGFRCWRVAGAKCREKHLRPGVRVSGCLAHICPGCRTPGERPGTWVCVFLLPRGASRFPGAPETETASEGSEKEPDGLLAVAVAREPANACVPEGCGAPPFSSPGEEPSRRRPGPVFWDRRASIRADREGDGKASRPGCSGLTDRGGAPSITRRPAHVGRTCGPRAPCRLPGPRRLRSRPPRGLEALRDSDTAPLPPRFVPFSFLLPPGASAPPPALPRLPADK